jgi:hypothetical protein
VGFCLHRNDAFLLMGDVDSRKSHLPNTGGIFREWSDLSGRGQGQQFGGSRLKLIHGIKHFPWDPARSHRLGSIIESGDRIAIPQQVYRQREQSVRKLRVRLAEAGAQPVAPLAHGPRQLAPYYPTACTCRANAA